MQSFANKFALITGGSSGIGLSLGRKLAALGADVCILARRVAQLQSAAEQIKACRLSPAQKVIPLAADVSRRAEVSAALDDVLKTTGTPDLLVNSAGVVHPGRFVELELDQFEWMIHVNYLGTVYTTHALVPAMLQRRSGHIVNVSSVAGYVGVYGYSAYSPSKFAVRGFSDVLRSELKPHGIRVSIAFPPDTDTPQLEYEKVYRPPVTSELSGNVAAISADQVAQAIIQGVRRNRYMIFPNFDSALTFHLSNLLGNSWYTLLDWMVAKALKKNRETPSPPA